jgi:hypothetical protein
MAALIVFLVFVALIAASGIAALRDMRPQKRPPEWSVGALIQPRR